jgi:hypothetical protein
MRAASRSTPFTVRAERPVSSHSHDEDDEPQRELALTGEVSLKISKTPAMDAPPNLLRGITGKSKRGASSI